MYNICIYICIYTSANMYVYIYIKSNNNIWFICVIYIYTYKLKWMKYSKILNVIHTHTHMYIYIHMVINLYVHICIYMYVFISPKSNIAKEKHAKVPIEGWPSSKNMSAPREWPWQFPRGCCGNASPHSAGLDEWNGTSTRIHVFLPMKFRDFLRRLLSSKSENIMTLGWL